MATPKGWRPYSLGEVAEYINGRAFGPEDWKDSGLPIVRIQNLTDRTKPFNYCSEKVEDRHYVSDGDMLVSWSATLGSFIWDRGPAVLNQHIFKVIPNTAVVEKEFLHYLILNTLREIARQAHGIAMQHITKSKFEEIQVALPSLTEQHRLIYVIKQCAERIEEIERLTVESCSEVSTILPSMFNIVFESLNSAKHVTIAELITQTRYGTSRKCHIEKQGTPILRIPNVADGFVNFDRLKYCDLTPAELNRLRLEDGDVLFVRTNGSRDLVGRCAVFAPNGANAAVGFASYLIRVRLNKTRILPKYLSYFLNSTKGRKQIDERRRTSAGQFNINSESLRSIALPLPSIQEQEQILSVLQEQEAQTIRVAAEIAQSAHQTAFLRESVLSRVFAGEL